MEFTTELNNNTTILKASGRMDIANAPQFEHAVQEILEKGCTRIVADMDQINYISSAGLRAILVAAKKIKASGGELCFANVKDMVLDVFTLSGFKSMFSLFECVDDALTRSED